MGQPGKWYDPRPVIGENGLQDLGRLDKLSHAGMGCASYHSKDGGALKEENMTEKQRAWLDASRKIGPGPMTKSERMILERLYADMLPAEQQQLAAYIKEEFGKQDDSTHEKGQEDPIEKMMQRTWPEPSPKLREKLGKIQTVKPPALGDNS